MRRLFTWCAAALLLPVAGASAQIMNGLTPVPRIFNDRPSSALTITEDNNPNGGTATIDERVFGTGGYTNRHAVELSADGGATSAAFGIDAAWTFSTTVNLSALTTPPHKEAGIMIRSPITGEAQFIVKTNGEIVAINGPFWIATDTYTPGTPMTLTMKMTSGGDGIGGSPNFIEYSYTNGVVSGSSGLLVWTNTEKGPLNYNLGVYMQGPPADPSLDFTTAVFNNVTYTAIPEPTTAALGLAALLGLAAIRRR